MTTEKATANIFLIRHAEKSPYGGESFSYTGGQRINALASLRIENLGHNIGYILVEKPSAGEYRSLNSRLIPFPRQMPIPPYPSSSSSF
jgi:hypothetical protein